MVYNVEPYSKNLLSQPESGMGYQIVKATLSNNEERHCVVFNAEVLVFLEYLELLKTYSSYDFLLKETEPCNQIIKELEVVSKSVLLKSAGSEGDLKPLKSSYKKELEKFKKFSKEEKLTQEDPTEEGEVFKRFSAYRNDKRLTLDKGLLPGTYATTKNDSRVVPSGLAAIARYALPHPFPAVYVFTIEPPKDTPIQCGTVQPAYNQCGGGVEVFFQKGCPKNAVTSRRTISER